MLWLRCGCLELLHNIFQENGDRGNFDVLLPMSERRLLLYRYLSLHRSPFYIDFYD